mgnify:CR=1 FL=1
MNKKPVFAKTATLLYKNMSTKKDRDYVGYINERNDEDQRFYDTRKRIVQKSFEIFMLPYLKYLVNQNPGRSIECLDIGCGDGVVLDALYALGKKHSFKINLHGLDLDKDALKAIKYKANLVVASALDMPFSDNKFDLITSSQTLEHFTEKDLKTTLKDTYRVLNKGGYFYAETPNPESLLAKAMGKDWWMYLEEHLVLIPPSYMEKILSEIGFKNIKVKTRMEVDEQINELSEIIVRLKSFYHQVIPVRVKAKLIKIYANLFRKGAVLVAVAQK